MPVGVFNEMDKITLMYQCTAFCWQCSAKPCVFVFCDRSSRQHAIDTYGIQWMIEIRELRPASALADDAFLSYYVKQKEAAQGPNSGMADPFSTCGNC